MHNAHLEIAIKYVDQILNGEILPPTMLEYMREIEDGFKGAQSLFERAKVTEEDGYLAIGYERTDLYMHIVKEAFTPASGEYFPEVAEIAYARATKQVRKTMMFEDIAELFNELDEPQRGLKRKNSSKTVFQLETARQALSAAAEDISDETSLRLADTACSDLIGRPIKITTENLDYFLSEITAKLGDPPRNQSHDNDHGPS